MLAELAWSALLAAEPIDGVIDLATRAFHGGLLVAERPGWSISVLNGVWALVLSEQHRRRWGPTTR